MMRVYIAGPMTGLPDFNYAAFHEEAARLRAQGFEVFNPAENPVPPCGTWTGYMRMAIHQLVKCDAIHLLRGWASSRGARLEHAIARELGLKIEGADL